MKHKIIVLLITLLSEAGHSDSLYYIRGGLWSMDPENVNHSVQNLMQWTHQNFPDFKLYVRHNSRWKALCEEMKKERGRLIVIGHSYGAQAGVDIAHCLSEERPIDLLVTIDSIQKPTHPRVSQIPDNVAFNFNFFQTQAIVLQGAPKNRRPDGSTYGIVNQKIQVPQRVLGHTEIVVELFKKKTLHQLITWVMSD